MSEHPATDYFGVWQRYRTVIDANYMHHAEFIAHIEQVLRSRFQDWRISSYFRVMAYPMLDFQ